MFKTLYAKLLIVIILLSFVPLMFFGYISYYTQRDILMEQIEQNLFVMSNNLAEDIHSLIAERLSDVQLLLTNPVYMNPNASLEEIREEFTKLLDSHNIYYGPILVDINGFITADTDDSIIGRNLSEREWFKKAMQGEIFFSDIYMSTIVHRPIVALSGPVKDRDGNIIGVFSPAFDLNNLWERIDRYNTLQKQSDLSATIFLMNAKGDIIAHPDRSKILNENFIELNQLSSTSLKEMSGNNTLFYDENIDSMNAISAIKKLPGFNNEWYAGIAINKNLLYAPLNQLLMKYILLFALVFIITLFAIIKLSHYITYPVNELVVAASSFASGEKVNPLLSNTYEEINILNRTFLEMTEKIKKREEELLRTEKLKVAGELTAALTHEIRNPLTTIKGLLTLIDESNNSDVETEKRYMPLIMKELDRMNNIINDFLSFAKPNAASNIKKIDIREILDEILTLYELQALQKRISIEKMYEPIPIITMDSNQIKQIFFNLIKNAFEAMPSGGVLKISVTYLSDENVLRISISDNGVGMDQFILDNLGTPFFTTKDTGTGLGLMTCKRIIKEMNGVLSVESDTHHGSTFTVKLSVKK